MRYAQAFFILSGFIDLNYASHPDKFALNLAQIQWTRTAKPIGFTIAAVAGKSDRRIYQASVAYRLPSGVTLEGGVYPSHIGLEGFYTKDNWNYSHSIMAEASPYYQAGINARYAFNEHWSGRVDVINGWQLLHGDAKAVGTQIAYGSDALTASFNTFVDSRRRFGDVVVIYKATPHLQLGGTVDLGTQGSSDWRGAGVYARFPINPRHAITLRAEHFNDSDHIVTNAAQRMSEVTLTYEMRPRDRVILKFEGRQDDGEFRAIAGVVVTF